MTSMKKPAPLDFKTQFGLALDESDDAIIVDLFAGGGGASTGLEIGLGRQVALAINHNPAAISMHMANHPHAAHYQTDVWGVDPLESTGGKTVAWLHASPTLIQVGYGEREGQAARVPGLEKPLGTVVAGGIKHALVIPHLVKFRFDATGAPVDQPMPTITSGGECARPAGAAHALGVASAVLVGAGGPSYGGKPVPVDQPLGTVVTENHRAIASAFMVQANGGYNTTHCRAMEAPMSTITNKGSQQQLATAHLVTLRKGSHGGPVDAPLGTQTGNDHHGLVAAHLLHLRGNCDGRGADEPLHTISAGGQHHGVVSAEMVGASLTPEQ